MKKELFFGQGDASAFIDWKKRRCILYDGTNEFHQEYGGTTYYVSRSGNSYAGWIPNKPYIQVGVGYRTEVRLLNTESFTGPFIPYNYRDAKIAYDYPVIFPIGSDKLPEKVVLMAPNMVSSIEDIIEEKYHVDDIEFRYVEPASDGPRNKKWCTEIYTDQLYSRYRTKSILIRLFGYKLLPVWDTPSNPFWDYLGIRIEKSYNNKWIAYKLGGYGIPVDWKHIENDMLKQSALFIVEYLGYDIGDNEFIDGNTIAVPTPNGFTVVRRYWENGQEKYRSLSPYDSINCKFWYDAEYRKEVLSRLDT